MESKTVNPLRVALAMLVGIVAIGAFQTAWKLAPRPSFPPPGAPPAAASPSLPPLPEGSRPLAVAPDFRSLAAGLDGTPARRLLDALFSPRTLSGLLDSPSASRFSEALAAFLPSVRSAALAALPGGRVNLLASLEAEGEAAFRDALAALCSNTRLSLSSADGAELLLYDDAPVLAFRLGKGSLEIFPPGPPPPPASAGFPSPPDGAGKWAAWGRLPFGGGDCIYLMRPAPSGFAWEIRLPFGPEGGFTPLASPVLGDDYAAAAGFVPAALESLAENLPSGLSFLGGAGDSLLHDAPAASLWVLLPRRSPTPLWALLTPDPARAASLLSRLASEADLEVKTAPRGEDLYYTDSPGFAVPGAGKVRFWAVRPWGVLFSSSEFSLGRGLDLRFAPPQEGLFGRAFLRLDLLVGRYLGMASLAVPGLDLSALGDALGGLDTEEVRLRALPGGGSAVSGETSLPLGLLFMYALHAYNGLEESR